MIDPRDVDARLDARGWKCPLPVLRASKLIALASAGERLLVESTDPRSSEDFRTWAADEASVALVEQRECDDPDGTRIYVHVIAKR